MWERQKAREKEVKDSPGTGKKQVDRCACLVGALENLPAPDRSIQPQTSKIRRLETLPGAAFPGSDPDRPYGFTVHMER